MIDPTQARAELTKTGTLRAAINIGNKLLARQNPDTEELSGASVALAHEIATRLGVSLTPVVYPSAGSVFAALDDDAWDIAFMAHQPERADRLNFSTPYFTIEGAYMVPENSPLRSVEEVDQSGIRIASVSNAAFDLHLKRTLKNAKLAHAAASSGSLPMFLHEKLDVLAGLRPVLEKTIIEHPDLRLLPGGFMEIHQCIATPKRNGAAAKFLDGFIKDAIESGFVEKAFAAT